MAHVDINKCISVAGGQHDLILMSAYRAREIQNGSESRIPEDYSAPVAALKEIERGLYTREEYDNRHIEELFGEN